MKKLLLLAGFLALASAAQAQTGACPPGTATVAINPGGWLCITPGGDYNSTTTAADGVTVVPVVTALNVLLFGPTVTNTATDAPTQTLNLGKPALNASGVVWVQRAELLALPVGQVYKGRAVAVGQPSAVGGPAQVSPRSPESNPFVRPAPVPAPSAPSRISVPE